MCSLSRVRYSVEVCEDVVEAMPAETVVRRLKQRNGGTQTNHRCIGRVEKKNEKSTNSEHTYGRHAREPSAAAATTIS